MGRVAYVGDREAEVEVQGGQYQELTDQRVLPGEGAAAQGVSEDTSEQPEDSAGSANGGLVEGPEVEVGDAAGESACEVECEKAALPERLFHKRAEEVQGEHVQGQVDEPRVQEHTRQQQPHLALGDGGWHEGALGENLRGLRH